MEHSKEDILYGMHDTPIGRVIIALSAKGLCWFGFMVEGYKGNGLERLKRFYPGAKLVHDDEETVDYLQMVLKAWDNDDLHGITLDLRGTCFQLAVWHALLEIPKGNVLTYGDIACSIGQSSAARAVGTAVGKNPVSLVVPCHRIVKASGDLGNYGWGVDIKRNLLSAEGFDISA